MGERYEGGCQCGSLGYRIDASLEDIAHCHCSICRRSSGGILTTWLTVEKTSFHWTRSTPKAFASSPSCTRYFCGDCGAHLALHTDLSPDTLDVSVATLDTPEQAPANRHIWVGSRLPWLTVDAQLPEETEEYISE